MNKVADNIKNRVNKDRLIVELQYAIDAENAISICYNRLASLIKNGRIRNKFLVFSEEAKTDKELLNRYLESLGINNFALENKCTFCKVNAESFSLIGAINLGLKVTNAATKFYKRLLGLSNSSDDKKLFKKLQKEKNEQRVFLKKEREFSCKNEDKSNFIDNYCIPNVISMLWK